MKVHDVKYVGSFPKESKCPAAEFPEYAFIGRSNVGKSSLINMLTGRKNLARVSNTPGKTQMINYYLVDESWHLVDLPGYGYAKISKKTREKWERMIEGYLVNRPTLQVAFVLLDMRHGLQQIDMEFLNWIGARHIPFVLVYTKADKVKPGKREEHQKALEDGILEHWHSLPARFVTSSNKKEGQEEILAFIEDLNNKF